VAREQVPPPGAGAAARRRARLAPPVVLRGLSAAPRSAGRRWRICWSSSRIRPRRRRWAAAASAIAIIAALGVMPTTAPGRAVAGVSGRRTKLRGVDADRRAVQRVRVDPRRARMPLRPRGARARRPRRPLGRHAHERVRRRACAASGPRLLDLRMQCLAERSTLRATVDVLAVADAAVVDKASPAAPRCHRSTTAPTSRSARPSATGDGDAAGGLARPRGTRAVERGRRAGGRGANLVVGSGSSVGRSRRRR
jgi:hypothetical protein